MPTDNPEERDLKPLPEPGHTDLSITIGAGSDKFNEQLTTARMDEQLRRFAQEQGDREADINSIMGIT